MEAVPHRRAFVCLLCSSLSAQYLLQQVILLQHKGGISHLIRLFCFLPKKMIGYALFKLATVVCTMSPLFPSVQGRACQPASQPVSH
jgi:hypothetical protein